MPLIMISGFPCSGKTHRSLQLKSHFESRIASSPEPRHNRLSVIHISDDLLGVSRGVYDAARSEKDARGTLSSAVKRSLGKDTIVICDAMNYIKGFRYQLFCEAKALQTTCCVVHVGTPIAKCKEINDTRLATAPKAGGDSSELPQLDSTSTPSTSTGTIPDSSTESPPYAPALFENLVFRYEEPNGMTRWDSPLFTVPFDDEEPPCSAIWDALVGEGGKSKVVKPNMATVLPSQASSNALQHLEHTTSTVVSAIQAILADNPDADSVAVPGTSERVRLPAMQKVGLPQLQRLRRQFLQMQRSQFGKLGGDGKGLEESRVAEAFVGFLNSSLGTE